MTETIGFIGLGLMGQPMAFNLLKAGYALKVYNRTASKIEPLIAQGAEGAAQPSNAALSGGIVVSIVSDDAALEEIVMSDGFLEHLGQGGLHISMSTVAPATSQKLAQLHQQHGSYYIDAPVFGPPPVAAARKLRICLAGPQAAKDRAKPVLEALGQSVYDFGETIGTANMIKIGGNFISFSAAQAMIEVLSLAKQMGSDPNTVMDMYIEAMFPIPVFQFFGKRMALDPEHFTPGWIGIKDTRLFKDTAQAKDVQTPLANFMFDLLTNK